jgi:hypothetical protein
MGSERRKRLIRVSAVTGIVPGAGDVAQSAPRNAGFAFVVPQMTPLDLVFLSAITETRLVLTDPSPDGMENPVPALVKDRTEVSGPFRRHARM